MNGRIEVILGDITKVKYDAIVNAANKSLLRGGGVDGAIHRAAGDELEKECKSLGGCPIGEARITKSYNLWVNKIGWVIHAAGPRWLGGSKDEERLLESAYLSSLKLAVNYKEVYTEQCLRILDKYISALSEAEKERISEEVRKGVEEYVKEHTIKTIAFPSISTGIYRFPLEKASKIAIETINDFLNTNSEIQKAAIICFDRITYDYYNNEIK